MALFITFEGGEGSGKSVQAKMLYQRLNKLAVPVVLTHEPGVTALGKKIDSILKWTPNVDISPIAELLMFNVSRAQLVKEIIADAIHYNSPRSDAPLIKVNCSALPESLIESELFGHEKGAFTGAITMKKGLIEMASKGTLFLDEITEMPSSMQVKLLRVIQEKEVLRVGGTEPLKVDVRFIAATNRDIQDAVKSGRFRQDLYFRLNVVSLHIPPLSERKDDIPLLSYYFLKKYALLMKKDIREISPDVIAILLNYDFPGNIRELENIIERGIALASGHIIEVAHLPEDLRELSIRTFRKKEGKFPSLEDQEKSYINWVLKEVGGNKTVAAQILRIDRVSLWRKLKKYGIEND